MKKTGIWLDFDKAYIIEIDNKEERIKKIDSNIEHFNVHGGSRSKVAYGPQDNVSESKLLARKQQQQKAYFENVMNQTGLKNDLILFGPAEAKINFKKAIQANSFFKGNILALETTDSMTENQMKAWLRDYDYE